MIFFHFHFVRIANGKKADLGWNRLQTGVIKGFYKPYIDKILKKEFSLKSTFSEYKGLSGSSVNNSLGGLLKSD